MVARGRRPEYPARNDPYSSVTECFSALTVVEGHRMKSTAVTRRREQPQAGQRGRRQLDSLDFTALVENAAQQRLRRLAMRQMCVGSIHRLRRGRDSTRTR